MCWDLSPPIYLICLRICCHTRCMNKVNESTINLICGWNTSDRENCQAANQETQSVPTPCRPSGTAEKTLVGEVLAFVAIKTKGTKKVNKRPQKKHTHTQHIHTHKHTHTHTHKHLSKQQKYKDILFNAFDQDSDHSLLQPKPVQGHLPHHCHDLPFHQLASSHLGCVSVFLTRLSALFALLRWSEVFTLFLLVWDVTHWTLLLVWGLLLMEGALQTKRDC